MMRAKTEITICVPAITCCLLVCIVSMAYAAEPANSRDSSGVSSNETVQDANMPVIPAQAAAKSSQGTFYIAPKPGSPLTRQLWQSRITAPQSVKDKQSKDELNRLIRLIRSVKVEQENKPSKTTAVAESPQAIESNETGPVADAPQKPAENRIKDERRIPPGSKPAKTAGPAQQPVSDKTLQMLDNLLQDPNQLKTPFELGEMLFRGGYLKQAALCYREALKRIEPNDEKSFEHKAWMLLQTANCLQHSDPQASLKIYGQLITEYPDCPWTEPAKAKVGLINWRLKDKPLTLINEPGT